MTRVYYSTDAISQQEKRERSMGNCEYCGRLCYPKGSQRVLSNPHCLGTRDHEVPAFLLTAAQRDKWGDDATIVLACNACNQIKAGHPPEPFRFWRKSHPGDGVGANRMAFNVFMFALAESGWRRVKSDASWGDPAKSIADLVAKFKERSFFWDHQ